MKQQEKHSQAAGSWFAVLASHVFRVNPSTNRGAGAFHATTEPAISTDIFYVWGRSLSYNCNLIRHLVSVYLLFLGSLQSVTPLMIGQSHGSELCLNCLDCFWYLYYVLVAGVFF